MKTISQLLSESIKQKKDFDKTVHEEANAFVNAIGGKLECAYVASSLTDSDNKTFESGEYLRIEANRISKKIEALPFFDGFQTNIALNLGIDTEGFKNRIVMLSKEPMVLSFYLRYSLRQFNGELANAYILAHHGENSENFDYLVSSLKHYWYSESKKFKAQPVFNARSPQEIQEIAKNNKTNSQMELVQYGREVAKLLNGKYHSACVKIPSKHHPASGVKGYLNIEITGSEALNAIESTSVFSLFETVSISNLEVSSEMNAYEEQFVLGSQRQLSVVVARVKNNNSNYRSSGKLDIYKVNTIDEYKSLLQSIEKYGKQNG